MGSVVTFYSYKGGVGRSMALANIAVLLAQQGKRVLVIDWDLEAPGLERYFNYFNILPDGAGLLPMLTDISNGHHPYYLDYVWRIDPKFGKAITFLGSGRELDPADYARKLESFDWNRFFHNGGGDRLEHLRHQWKQDFDLVLIDSRTGLSDTGGVCTILLPDIVVLMFTANDQSLLGARDVLRYVREARQTLAYPRMELTVFPLPARISSASEFQETQRWTDRFSNELREFYEDWLPSWAQPREVLQKVKIPQVDYFGYGEKLAVVEQGVSDPNGMGYAYDLVTQVLSNDFRNAHEILDLRERVSKEEPQPGGSASTEDYEYDLYVSQASSSYRDSHIAEFLDELTDELTSRIGRHPRIFWDRKEVVLGSSFPERVTRALTRSRLLMPILSRGYFTSKWNMAEWTTFRVREENWRRDSGNDEARLFFPVELDSPEGTVHVPGGQRTVYRISTSSRARSQEAGVLSPEDLSVRIGEALRTVPPFSPDFPLFGPANLKI